MHDLSPYIPAPSYTPVRAVVRGEQREGHVLGWRGERVYLRWTSGVGLHHLTWVPAADVERVTMSHPPRQPDTSSCTAAAARRRLIP